MFRVFSAEDVQFSSPGTSLPSPESVDRFIAEDTVRRILASHEGNRKEWWVTHLTPSHLHSPHTLTHSATALMGFSETARERLRLSADYVITEVLFAHMLHLPRPPQVLVYYSAVLIELCKSNPAVYPQLVSGCVAIATSLYNQTIR